MNHYMAFVSQTPTFGWGSVVGWTGVDLFFVLSGYLIANQIFAGLARGATLSPGSFYARRALRTLPVFWLVLALYFLFPAVMGGNTPPPLWRFLTFTQNIGLRPGTAFSHAWSLCIEEQFYLILPLVLAIGAVATAALLYFEYRFYNIDGYGYTFFMTAAGYSLLAITFAVLVTAALSPGSWLHRVRIPGAYHIALWSYSTYLSHKAIMVILRRLLQPLDPAPLVMISAVAIASVLVGALLYRLVESPFMAIRDRRFPTSFAKDPGRLPLRTQPATAQTPSAEY
jgi:peptidoglycan/LPS O-acetylase OafA/YrhL